MVVAPDLCGDQVGAFCERQAGLTGIRGDGDPLDVCVLAERTIPHGDVLLRARPLGGLRMIDADQADDKVLAVMEGDAAYGSWQDVGDCPAPLLERLRHYFLTYKDAPGAVRTQFWEEPT